jgi:hypothetical protein
MNDNRRFAVEWATSTLHKKPGRRRGRRRLGDESTVLVALSWGTYRTLTQHAGLDANQFESWLNALYRTMFLP